MLELDRNADNLSFPEIINVLNDCQLLKCHLSLEDECELTGMIKVFKVKSKSFRPAYLIFN